MHLEAWSIIEVQILEPQSLPLYSNSFELLKTVIPYRVGFQSPWFCIS